MSALDETAEELMQEMYLEGYTSGQLFDNIRMFDDDGDEGIEYTGWWDLVVSSDEVPVYQGEANPKGEPQARALYNYGSDDIRIDDVVQEVEDGFWVQAQLWIPKETEESE